MVGGQLPGATQGLQSCRSDQAGGEAFEVDTARDGNDFFGIDGVLADHMVAGEFAVGDDHVAASHHRIIPALERRFGVVDPVIGRHERDFLGTCGPKGAERWRARTGVNDADAFALNQVRQPGGVTQHHQRILRLYRHLCQVPALGLQSGRHTATARGDDALAPGIDHRVRDINRRLLGPARFEFGRYLQKGKIWRKSAHGSPIALMRDGKQRFGGRNGDSP